MAEEVESKAERQRRLARERKARQREREAEEALKGRKVEFIAYRATQDSLALICEVGGFEQEEEALTLMIHNIAELARRDRHAFDKFTAIPSRSGDADA